MAFAVTKPGRDKTGSTKTGVGTEDDDILFEKPSDTKTLPAVESMPFCAPSVTRKYCLPESSRVVSNPGESAVPLTRRNERRAAV